MKPPDVFGILVRTVGLVITLGATCKILSLLPDLLGGSWTALMSIGITVPVLLVGLWLLRGANALINFAYPEK